MKYTMNDLKRKPATKSTNKSKSFDNVFGEYTDEEIIKWKREELQTLLEKIGISPDWEINSLSLSDILEATHICNMFLIK